MTQKQALKYIGRKMRNPKASANRKQYKARNIPAEDEAREMLAAVVLSHIPSPNYNFRCACADAASSLASVVRLGYENTTQGLQRCACVSQGRIGRIQLSALSTNCRLLPLIGSHY